MRSLAIDAMVCLGAMLMMWSISDGFIRFAGYIRGLDRAEGGVGR